MAQTNLMWVSKIRYIVYFGHMVHMVKYINVHFKNKTLKIKYSTSAQHKLLQDILFIDISSYM